MPTSSSVDLSRKPPQAPKPAGAFDNYSTAESLGYTDPDEERRVAELERKRTQGTVGQWEVVAPPPPPLTAEMALKVRDSDSKDNIASSSFVPEKTEAQEIEEHGGRGFKLRKRKLDAGLDDIWDPGAIQVKVPKTETSEVQLGRDGSIDAAVVPSSDTHSSASIEKPKWTPKGWKRAGDSSERQPPSPPEQEEPQRLNSMPAPSIKTEEVPELLSEQADNLNGIAGQHANVKKEEESTNVPPAALFRKRKIPAKR